MWLLVLVYSHQDLMLRHWEAHEAIVLNDDRSFHNLKCGYKMNIFYFIFFLHKDAIASPVFFAVYSNFIHFFLSPLVPFIFFPSFFIISLYSYPLCPDLFCYFCLLFEAGSPLPHGSSWPWTCGYLASASWVMVWWRWITMPASSPFQQGLFLCLPLFQASPLVSQWKTA